MIKVGVTGATGLLGSTLMQELAGFGLQPIALASDIRNARTLHEEVAEALPNWIVHTAALTNVGECEKDPEKAHAVNALGTANVVEAARAADISVIYISTASVFSGITGNYTEEDMPEPSNVYNKSKVEGENAVAAYEKGMILRLNLIGIHPKGSRGKNFLEWLVDTIAANKDLTLFNDQFINPLSNWTIAGMIGSLIAKNVSEKVLHIGCKDVVSKADIGRLILAKFPNYSGAVTDKSIDTVADGVVRPKQMWINTKKAERLLGMLPTLGEEIQTIFNKYDGTL